jgi:hypothetical protein
MSAIWDRRSASGVGLSVSVVVDPDGRGAYFTHGRCVHVDLYNGGLVAHG